MPVTAAAVAVAAAQAISFATKDGWTIAASYRPASKGKATVVLAHGVGSSGSEWSRFAAALAAKGVGTLAIDLRGHAGSRRGPPGSTDFTGFDQNGGWSAALEDLRAAAAWLEKRGVPRSRIAFGGASIGANLASLAALEREGTPFLILLSPGADYRGVRPRLRVGLKTLAAASPPDGYAFATVQQIASRAGAAEIVSAPAGHGVQMFDDPATFERIVAWTVKAASHR